MTRLAQTFLVLALASNLSAQTSRTVDWPELNRLAQGKSVALRLTGGETVEGRITSGEPTQLRVAGRSVACTDISSVEVPRKGKRALWTVVGAAAGLAAGAVLATRFSNEGNDGAAAGLAAGLAGAGAGLGYLAGGKGKTRTFTLGADSCPAS